MRLAIECQCPHLFSLLQKLLVLSRPSEPVHSGNIGPNLVEIAIERASIASFSEGIVVPGGSQLFSDGLKKAHKLVRDLQNQISNIVAKAATT